MNISAVAKLREKRSAFDVFLMILMAFYLIQKMPIVSYYTNTYISMLVYVLMLVLFLSVDKVCLNRLPILLLAALFYAGQYALDLALEGTQFFYLIWSVFLALLPIFVGTIIVYNKMDYLARIAVPLILIAYTFTALTTYLGLLDHPEASRLMAADPTAYHRYFPHNIGGFNFVYSFVLLHPLMICYLREKRLWFLAPPLTAIGGMCVLASEYTTAALLFVISCIAYFFPSRTTRNRARFRTKLILFAMVLALLFLPSILDFLAELPIFASSEEKLQDVANVLRGQESESISTQNRIYFYQKSWDSFAADPMLGGKVFGRSRAGGHSFVLDTLADWGIVGFALVAILYWYFRKLYSRICKKSSASLYATLFFLLIIAICVLNPHAWLFEVGFAAPVFLFASTPRQSLEKEDLKKGENDQ